MTTLGFIGTEVTIEIVRGGTFGPFSGTVTTGGDPVDLTGSSFEGQVRKAANASAVAAEFNVEITDAAAGEFEYGLTDEQTLLIAAANDPDDPKSQYVWDIFWTDSLGQRKRIAYGPAIIHYGVTRD